MLLGMFEADPQGSTEWGKHEYRAEAKTHKKSSVSTVGAVQHTMSSTHELRLAEQHQPLEMQLVCQSLKAIWYNRLSTVEKYKRY